MDFQPSDAVFIALVLIIAIQLLGGGGGGRRSRIPVAA
jgi:Flp pilus assembly pilin Flp